MSSRRLLLGLLVLAIVTAAVLLLKPEWWREEQANPEFSAYLSVQEPREALLDNFRSYDSEQQITQLLAAADLRVTAERVHVEGTRKYPPYKLDTLTVADYGHLGHQGTLILDFFNDRLASATFRPVNPKAYLRQVQKTGISFRREDLSRWAQQTGNQRITTNIIFATSHVGSTLNTPPYVSWEDTRLTAQSRQWYDVYGSRYAIAPIRALGPGSDP